MLTSPESIKRSLAEETLAIVNRQKESLEAITDNLPARLSMWRDRTMRMLSQHLVNDELEILGKINTSSYVDDKAAFLTFLSEIENGVRDMPELYLQIDPLPNLPETTAVPAQANVSEFPVSNNVFIVHGHDGLAKLELARTLERLKLNAIVLHEQANEGKTIIEKFERDASRVSFAVALLTPDDVGHPQGKPDEAKGRARQNVVLELGFFSGVLGRSNVCVLYKGAVEIPSDYLGVVYIEMDDAGAWRFALAKELKQAGLPVDLNDLA
jgi:predicted nucleotide-binding protein